MELSELARVLRERREAIGTTKAEIGRRINSSESYVLLVEQGKRRPSQALLERWAKALGWGEEYTKQLLVLAGHVTAETPEENVNPSLPLIGEELHFPQPRSMERDRLLQEVRGLLDRAMEAPDKQWEQMVNLLSSYIAWLPSYIGILQRPQTTYELSPEGAATNAELEVWLNTIRLNPDSTNDTPDRP
jgi:transcriptional regulator with XRE-family HTH domain